MKTLGSAIISIFLIMLYCFGVQAQNGTFSYKYLDTSVILVAQGSNLDTFIIAANRHQIVTATDCIILCYEHHAISNLNFYIEKWRMHLTLSIEKITFKEGKLTTIASSHFTRSDKKFSCTPTYRLNENGIMINNTQNFLFNKLFRRKNRRFKKSWCKVILEK